MKSKKLFSSACKCSLGGSKLKPILPRTVGLTTTTTGNKSTNTKSPSLYAGIQKSSSSSSNGADFDINLLTRIYQGNHEWREESAFQFSENVENVLLTQKPQATLLTCCDSRAPSAALGLIQAGQTFEIRNIGNQAMNALGSISYGVEVLKTPYLLVMGHTNCGAVMGALSDYRNLHSMIQRELLPLVKSIRFAQYVIDGDDKVITDNEMTLNTFNSTQDNDKKVNMLAEINVDFQILQLLDDWKVKRAVNQGQLNIIGLMFDIHNIYGNGNGQIQFVNINGDTNVDSLRQNALFVSLREEDKQTAVHRLFEYPQNFVYRNFSE